MKTDTRPTMKTQHTEALYDVHENGFMQRYSRTLFRNGKPVADFYGDDSPEAKDEAKFICRAVNSHDALVENLKRIIFRIEGVDGAPSIGELAEARAALAQAEGRAS